MVRGKVRGLDIVSTWVEFGSTGARSGRKSLREEMAEFALSSRPAKCPKSSAGQSLASARIVAEYLATSGVQFRTWLPHFELLLLISSIVSPGLMNQRGLGVFLFIICLDPFFFLFFLSRSDEMNIFGDIWSKYISDNSFTTIVKNINAS